jgi:hypothetical protein
VCQGREDRGGRVSAVLKADRQGGMAVGLWLFFKAAGSYLIYERQEGYIIYIIGR